MANPHILEILLIATVLALAAAPIAYLVSRNWGTAIVSSVAVLLAGVGIGSWSMPKYSAAKTPSQDVMPNKSHDNGYVSADACRACHPQHHTSWDGSYHSSMTQVATDDTVIGSFDNVSTHGYGWKYRLFEEDGERYAEVDSKSPWAGKHRVVMTTGSHHLQYVWAETERKNHVQLIQSAFLFEDNRWVPRESVFLLPPHGKGPPRRELWAQNCIRCHSTGPQPGRYDGTKVGDLSISCEACHGPGRDHVEANQDLVRRYRFHGGDEPDPTIINPARLSPRHSSQICGYCHSHASHSQPPANPPPGQPIAPPFPDKGHAYRPGDELDDTVFIDSHTEYTDRGSQLLGRFWPDGMVRGSGREYSDLVQSPCFQGGHESNQMGCLSCHSMHKEPHDTRSLKDWADDQLKVGMRGDQGCMQCHQMDDIPAHTHHPVESSGSRCYNCHMPHTTYGIMKAIRAHQNTNPSVQTTLDTKRQNACNLCHLDKSLGWTADYLTRWYDQPTPELTEEQETVSAIVLDGLRARADVRVLAAWHMGWQEAVEASGNSWLAPYLGQLLQDPYDVIRFIAFRSLKRLPGFADFEYDWLGPAEERADATRRVLEKWKSLDATANQLAENSVLINADGTLNEEAFKKLLSERDDSKIFIEE